MMTTATPTTIRMIIVYIDNNNNNNNNNTNNEKLQQFSRDVKSFAQNHFLYAIYVFMIHTILSDRTFFIKHLKLIILLIIITKNNNDNIVQRRQEEKNSNKNNMIFYQTSQKHIRSLSISFSLMLPLWHDILIFHLTNPALPQPPTVVNHYDYYYYYDYYSFV